MTQVWTRGSRIGFCSNFVNRWSRVKIQKMPLIRPGRPSSSFGEIFKFLDFSKTDFCLILRNFRHRYGYKAKKCGQNRVFLKRRVFERSRDFSCFQTFSSFGNIFFEKLRKFYVHIPYICIQNIFIGQFDFQINSTKISFRKVNQDY